MAPTLNLESLLNLSIEDIVLTTQYGQNILHTAQNTGIPRYRDLLTVLNGLDHSLLSVEGGAGPE